MQAKTRRVLQRLLVTVGALVIGLLLWWFWGWLTIGPDGPESGSTTLRNIGLLVGAWIAWRLTKQRIAVADRQAGAAQEQVKTALDQVRTSQQSLLNDRYQRGAQMLGDESLPVRLGGIYALNRLAEQHPEEYHVQIMGLLCAFVRHPTESGTEVPDTEGVREDVQAALDAIGSRSPNSIELEDKKTYWPNLKGAHLPQAFLAGKNLTRSELPDANLSRADLRTTKLSGADLRTANLSDANLHMANLSTSDLSDAYLSRAELSKADLSRADLSDANLSDATLIGADLSRVDLGNANLSGADLSRARHLTQDQLNEACAYPDMPPKLFGVFDHKTSAQMEWHENPCD